VDRLSRSLLDFARVIDRFDQRSVSFVSVTQQFNTTSSLGRLTLNILLSFAHYAESAIMQSHSAEVAVWPAFRSYGTPHYPGSNREAIGA
jgi:site-specific DNA recombinase